MKINKLKRAKRTVAECEFRLGEYIKRITKIMDSIGSGEVHLEAEVIQVEIFKTALILGKALCIVGGLKLETILTDIIYLNNNGAWSTYNRVEAGWGTYNALSELHVLAGNLINQDEAAVKQYKYLTEG